MLHSGSQLPLHLTVTLLDARLFCHVVLLGLPLLPLESDGRSLSFKLCSLSPGSLLQNHQLSVVLLGELLLLLLHLLLQLEVELMPLLVCGRVELVCLLPVGGTQELNTIFQLNLQALSVGQLLALNLLGRWESAEEPRGRRSCT